MLRADQREAEAALGRDLSQSDVGISACCPTEQDQTDLRCRLGVFIRIAVILRSDVWASSLCVAALAADAASANLIGERLDRDFPEQGLILIGWNG